MPSNRWVPALALATVCMGPAACGTVKAAVHEPYPAVTIADGADKSAPKTLALTANAVRRLELVTVVVDDAESVPYAAVVYDKKGEPWVYSNPRDLTFIRIPVTIQRVDGDAAILSAGPPADTRVVTRGAIKLYGAENGVGGGH